MKKYGSGKTGTGSFYTHIMVRPGDGKPDYRIERPYNDQVLRPDQVQHHMQKVWKGKQRHARKAFLESLTKYFGKKVAA